MRTFTGSVLAIVLAGVAVAGGPLAVGMTTESPPRVQGAPPLSANGIRLEREGCEVATLWLAPAPPDRPAPEAAPGGGVNFRAVGPDRAVGIIRLARPWHDYRGQEVPAGTYLLRYAVQPRLKDHIGTSAYRDFLILEGAAGRRASTGDDASDGGHPFVMALVPAASPSGPPSLQGTTLDVEIAGVRAGLVLEGTGNVNP